MCLKEYKSADYLKKRMVMMGFRNPDESQAKRMCKSKKKRAGNAEHLWGGG